MSLATTWYHMFCFFQWSYREWELPRATAGLLPVDRDGLYLGDWLRDTTLFKQAWVSTLETPLRAWWSTQIFGFYAIWSVKLAAQAHKRNISHLWLFMLLGQIVAISFAANLSFLAFLVYDQDDTPPADKKKEGPEAAVTKSFVVVAVRLGRGSLHRRDLRPRHSRPGWPSRVYLPAAGAAPAGVYPFPSERRLCRARCRAAERAATAHGGQGLLYAAFARVFDNGGDLGQILETLYEHPAVSSVGWMSFAVGSALPLGMSW